MKRALAALSAAFALAGCHITVVPAPVARTASVDTTSTESTGLGETAVVVMRTDRDSVRMDPTFRSGRPAGSDDGEGADSRRTDRGHESARDPHEGGQDDLPPGLEKRDGLPPGLAKRDSLPPGLSKHNGTPPGLAKKDGVPPGQEKHDGVPPGLAKKDAVAPGQVKHDGVAPGQEKKDGVIPGQAAKGEKTDQPEHGGRPGRAGKGADGGNGAKAGEGGNAGGAKAQGHQGGKPDNAGNGAKSDGGAKADDGAKGGQGHQPDNAGATAKTNDRAKADKSAKPEHAANADSGARADEASSTETDGTAATPSVAVVSIADLVSSDAHVGERVQVTGTCLAAKRGPAVGGAPSGKDDWQLGTGTVAIWVTGVRPEACSASDGGAEPVTVTATVAQDRLPARGKKAGAMRSYLVAG